jgi:hypothetical protein
MDTSLVIGLVVLLVVGFFGWQWYSAASRRKGGAGNRKAVPVAPIGEPVSEPAPVRPAAAPVAPAPEVRMPGVAGQSEEDLRAKQPDQERRTGSHYEPVTADNMGPASVADNLRHPEAMFHQPTGAPPGLQQVDVPAGRASAASTMGVAGQANGSQGFSPEMAQNGGAIVGNSVFAFDGMEPTGFASF